MAFYKRLTVNVTATLGTTDQIDLREWEGCRLKPGTGVTSLTFYEATEKDETYVVANGTTASSAVAMTGLTAEQTYQMPTTMNGSHWVKLVANTTGTVTLMLKKAT